MSNSAHSDRWKGPSSRGTRRTSKLGRALDLRRLERLLREAHRMVTRAREAQR